MLAPQRVLAIVLLGALLSLSLTADAAKPPLSALAVRSGDVRGFRRIQATYYNNVIASRVDRVALATFNRRGRLLSYNVSFVRPESKGVFKVENVVAKFKTAAGARWDYRRVVHGALQRKARRSYRNFRRLRVGNIGWERSAFGYQTRGRTRRLLVDVVRFYRGKYRVTLQVIGLAGKAKPKRELGRLIRLARTVDRRIRSSG